MTAAHTEVPAPLAPEFPDVDADGYVPDDGPSIDELAAQHDAEMFGEQDADLDVTDTRSDGEAAGWDEALAEQADEMFADAIAEDDALAALPDDEASQEAPEPEAVAAEPVLRTFLTDDEKVTAKALRQQGLLISEIVEHLRLSAPDLATRPVSVFLRGVPQGHVKAKATRKAGPSAAIPTADWPTFIEAIPTVAGSRVAWARATYCMVRVADGYPAGVPKGAKLHDDLPFPWATVCGHGAVIGATKGGQAENLGKARTTWCKRCEAGEPMDVPGLSKTERPAAADAAERTVGVIDLSEADRPRVWVGSRRIVQGPDLAQMLADAEAAAHQEHAERLLAAEKAAQAEATDAAVEAAKPTRKTRTRARKS